MTQKDKLRIKFPKIWQHVPVIELMSFKKL